MILKKIWIMEIEYLFKTINGKKNIVGDKKKIS